MPDRAISRADDRADGGADDARSATAKCYFGADPRVSRRSTPRARRARARGAMRETVGRRARRTLAARCKPARPPRTRTNSAGAPARRSYPAGFGTFLLVGFFVFIVPCCFVRVVGRHAAARQPRDERRAAARRRRTQQEIVELRSRRESFAESTPTELADAHVVEIADGASEIAAEEVHEVKAEARSSRDFSRELGDFFDGLGPAAYAQEAPPPDSESDDETKTPS